MTATAIVFLALSLVLVWGGLAASAIALAVRPERRLYPAGGDDDEDAPGV